MDKRTEPKRIRFRTSVFQAITNIAFQQDKTFSQIHDELLDFALYHRSYVFPFCKEDTSKNGNGQENGSSTLP